MDFRGGKRLRVLLYRHVMASSSSWGKAGPDRLVPNSVMSDAVANRCCSEQQSLENDELVYSLHPRDHGGLKHEKV